MLPHVHVITPGDHYSPRTGSAIPTVVHGLATAGNTLGLTTRVAVARGTYPDRYTSAEILEYDELPAGRHDRRVDAVTGRLGLGRPRTRRRYGTAVAAQADWEPSVVLVHNAPQGIGAVDAARHVPVLYAHNELLRTYSQREAGRALENAARIVCVSEFLAERTRDRLPPSLCERVAVVRNGVDTEFFHPADGGNAMDGLRVAFVGRMIHDKGADVLVEAVRLLASPDISLTLVGSAGFDPAAALTPYEQSIRASASALLGPVSVHPFLPRDQVAEIMRHAEVLVVPSRWPEPYGLTVLEGMASGAAVVASRVGGVTEAGGDAVILVEPDDPAALAARLKAIAGDHDELAALQRRSLQHATAMTWSHALDELVALLGRLGPR